MKMSDVTILKSINPIELEEKPSNYSYEFLHRLCNQEDALKDIETKRLEYGVPKEGYDIKKEIGKNFNSLLPDYVLGLKIVAQDYSKSTGDNEDYLYQILLLIFYNSIIEVTKIKSNEIFPIKFVFGRKRISDILWNYDKEVGAIIIPFNVSKTFLKSWIDDSWSSMCEEMSENYTSNPIIQRIHKNILKEERIRTLKSEGKSLSQILEVFKKEWPDERWYLSKIKKINADEKQRIDLQKWLSNNKIK